MSLTRAKEASRAVNKFVEKPSFGSWNRLRRAVRDSSTFGVCIAMGYKPFHCENDGCPLFDRMDSGGMGDDCDYARRDTFYKPEELQKHWLERGGMLVINFTRFLEWFKFRKSKMQKQI